MAFHNMDAILKNLKEISKAPNVGEKIQRNQMLLVSLSTTMMLAKKLPLPKEHYQWTRVFLNGIRDENGHRLENLVGLVAEMDRFEKEHNVEDDLIGSEVANEPETPAIAVDDSSDDDSVELIPDGAARSTGNIPRGPEGEEKTDDAGDEDDRGAETDVNQKKSAVSANKSGATLNQTI